MNWQLALKDWFSAHDAEGIELLADLVRQNTVNPPGNEHLAAAVVTKYLAKHGIAASVHEGAPGRANVLATIGSGTPVVFVGAHSDVVPFGDGWHTDPLNPVVKNGCMYGRGVADNKGPLVSMLLLATFLKRHEKDFKGTFLLGAVADEECGSDLGMAWLLDQGLVKADYAIVPDTGSSIHKISCGEKGLLHIEIEFIGRQAHGSTPEHGLSAIWAAHAFLDMIRSLFGDTTGYCKDSRHELLSPASINIGSIHAGSAYNIIPGSCTLRLDIRFLPGESSADYVARFTELAEKIQHKGLCVDFKITVESDMPPFILDAENLLVRAANASVHAMTGMHASRFGMSGTTVCKQLLKHGIPAIGWSQESSHQAHMANEHLRLSEVGLFGQALGLAFLKIGENW